MSVKCKEIINIMEELAPKYLAESWDNPGLLVGSPQSDVKKILVALDAVEDVIDEAVEIGADLIITHHPIIFGSIKKVTSETAVGVRLFKLIQHGINVYSAHTNLDVAFGGTNDVLADMMGLKNIKVLDETSQDKLIKIAVYVPKGYEEKVKLAMCKAGAGHAGNYSNCTFSINGEGSFKPLEGSNPFIGNKDVVEKVSEVKIETVVQESKKDQVIKNMIEAHPYEEVAYDVYRLEQEGNIYGIGRIGELENEMTFELFAKSLKEKLGLKTMRVVGDLDKSIKKVGLCTGSGFEFIDKAVMGGADVYITGDLRFHESQKALDAGICVIDATHYASENIVVPALCNYLNKKAQEHKLDIEVFNSNVNGQPFKDI